MLVEDPIWYPRLVSLAGCLCNELEAAGLDTCFCGVITGTTVDLSRVFSEHGGMGWVRLASIEPLPMEGAGSGLCMMPMVARVEVGYGDCFPVPDMDSHLSVEDELDAARRVQAGIEASRRAIFCCEWGAEKGSIGDPRWAPGGPEGGAVWSVWSFTMEHY